MLSIWLFASAIVSSTNCAAFALGSAQPIAVQIERISGKTLDPHAKPSKPDEPWESPTYQIGQFIYQGNGFQYRSADRRFPQIADSVAKAHGRICGYQISIPDGYDAANGRYLKRGEIIFQRLNQDSSSAPTMTADDPKNDNSAITENMTNSSFLFYTSKDYLRMYLIHRDNTERLKKTSIAVSSAKGDGPSRIVATLTGYYSSMSLMPQLHGTTFGIFLEGRGDDGALRQFPLRMSDRTAENLAILLTGSTSDKVAAGSNQSSSQ